MPLLYAPDKDHRTPGILVEVRARPTEAGYASIPQRQPFPASVGIKWAYTLGGNGQTIFGCTVPGGGGRLYSGYKGAGAGNSKLFEFTVNGAGVGAVTDVSIAAAYTCTAAPTAGENFADTWQFVNWGTVVLATNLSETARTVMQVQTTSGAAFADLATSPRAACLEVFKDFILAGNINTTFGGGIVGTSDMIAWSDQAAYTVWTPASGVQANWTRLRDTPGDIVAMKKLGDAVIVYKRDSIYRLTYIGGAYTFKVEKIVDGIGCMVTAGSPPQIMELGAAHIFRSRDDVYLFDGTRPIPIGTGSVMQYVTTPGAPYAHDHQRGDVYFGGGFIYNYKFNKWGKDSDLALTSGSTPIFGINISGAVQSVLLNSAVANSAVPVSRVWGGSNAYSESAICYHNWDYRSAVYSDNPIELTTGLYGTHDRRTLLKRVHPIAGYGVTAGGDEPGTTFALVAQRLDAANWDISISTSVTGIFDAARRRFDLLSESYYHKVKLTVTPTTGGVIEIRDIIPTLVPTGGKD